MRIEVETLAQAEAIMAETQQRNPDAQLQSVHVRTRMVEAGIEVTISGGGLHAVVTIDPSKDPEPIYAILQHVPDVVHSSLLAFVEKHAG